MRRTAHTQGDGLFWTPREVRRWLLAAYRVDQRTTRSALAEAAAS